MGKVKEFGQQIAEYLQKNDEEGAKTFIRTKLTQGYTKPPMTEQELQSTIQWWLDETRKAMADGLFAV